MNYKEMYTDEANTLGDVPKDLKYLSQFNILKLAVMQKVENDIKSGKINIVDAEELFTIRDKNDVLGFTERYLNVMMYYAFEEGKNSVKAKYTNHAKKMNEAYEKIVSALDDVDMIPENCTCDN